MSNGKKKETLPRWRTKDRKRGALLGRSAVPGSVHVHPEGFFVVYNFLYVIFQP
jgi:hypothetical protein